MPKVGPPVTPDQIARVERLRDDWLALARASKDAEVLANAASLTALLAEREALRAALPTRDQLEALLFVGDAFVEGPFCAACHEPNDLDTARGQLIPKHKPDCWLAALLTGTTARAEDEPPECSLCGRAMPLGSNGMCVACNS